MNDQGSTGRGANDPHPQEDEQSHANEGQRTGNHVQAKEHKGQENVVQVKELNIVTQAFRQEGRCLFNVKGTLFANAKKDRNAAQMFALKERSDVALGGFGNAGRDASHGIAGSARVPFLLAVIVVIL